MSRYSTWRQARSYNTRLRRFSERTLSEARAVVDAARLRSVKTREGEGNMIDTMSTMLTIAEKREAQIARVSEKIYSAAQSSAVYSEPVTTGTTPSSQQAKSWLLAASVLD